MGITSAHEGPRRRRITSWIGLSSWILVFPAAQAPTPLPPGAVTLINEDHYGSMIALCADTGEPFVQQGARRVRSTAVWAGERSSLHRVEAGLGACDPVWSPDGRYLAVTSAEGLWVLRADSQEASLRVESRLPFGGATEFNYRAFSQPRWSADGMLVALLVTNASTSWVEVFEVGTGRLLYTSPPENYSFSWGEAGRELKMGSTEVHLPSRR
jgi:hypothetical protein